MKTKKPKTQKQDVLHHLETRKRGITNFDAFRLYAITRLGDVIYQLRRDGIEIETNIVKAKDHRGKSIQFARYTLKKGA